MQDDMTPQSPAGRAAAWLARYARNRAAALDWIDESWLPTWLADAATRQALSTPESVDALMHALAVPVPDVEPVFAHADDRRVDTRGRAGAMMASLPVLDQLRVLRLRALVFRRAEVRRVIDLQRRARLSASLGTVGGAQLRWLQALPGAPEMPILSRTIEAPTLDTLDEAALAWEGYCLLERDGALDTKDAVAALLRLGLPRALRIPAWLARCARGIDADGSERILTRLPILFPEHAWSFGCETLTSN